MTKRIFLMGAGWLLAIVAALALLRDIVSPDVAPGTPVAQVGFQIGTAVGIAIRTFVFGGGALALLHLAKSPPKEVWGRTEVASVVAKHRRLLPAERPSEAERYQNLSASELLDVYEHLD